MHCPILFTPAYRRGAVVHWLQVSWRGISLCLSAVLMMGSFKKADIEASLQEEHKMIQEGKLKEDNPLDLSDTFRKLCEACRRGDLRSCQEMITEGANINARDRYDYTPLILVTLLHQILINANA